jgi:hypothetical protein
VKAAQINKPKKGIAPRRAGTSGQRRQDRRSGGPSDLSMVYNGPIASARFLYNKNLVTASLFAEGSLSSSAGGVLNNVFNSGSATWNNFSSYANLYDEFRCLGFQLEFFPSNRYTKATTTCVPVIGVVDRADSNALTSYTGALTYASARMLSLEDPWSSRSEYKGSSVPCLRIRMRGIEEAQWLPVASTFNAMSIKLWASGLTASISYGLFLLRGLIQFRGQG